MSASSVGENMFGNNSMSNSSSSESDDEENSRLKEAAVGKEIKTSEILSCSQFKKKLNQISWIINHRHDFHLVLLIICNSIVIFTTNWKF